MIKENEFLLEMKNETAQGENTNVYFYIMGFKVSGTRHTFISENSQINDAYYCLFNM